MIFNIFLALIHKVSLIKLFLSSVKNKTGSTLVELIVVTVLFAILVPSSLGIFVGARKITGQSYVQHQAAVTLGETNDILQFMRNLGYDLIPNGGFYLIRNPGTDRWLVKNELPDKDTFERYITVSDAKRHSDTDDIYFDDDSGAFYDDPNTKRIDINILWAPDYIPLDIISQTIYISNWQNTITYQLP